MKYVNNCKKIYVLLALISLKKERSAPMPTGRNRVCVNLLNDIHSEVKKLAYENVTKEGPIVGIKRKNEEKVDEEKETK